MAGEIRDLLKANPGMTGREVLEALKAANPKRTINANSCGVAFSNARKSLGIARVSQRRTLNPLARLNLAKQLLAACGGSREAADAALNQLEELQV